MLAPHLKSKVDELWNKFWSAGITNPLVAIEQITYLFVAKDIRMEVQRRGGISRDWLQETLSMKATFTVDDISKAPNALLEAAILSFQARHQVNELYQGVANAHR